MRKAITLGIVGGMLLPLSASEVFAQEVDRVSAPNAVGVGMAKGIVDQLGGGRGDINTPGSSLYLIARDPARAIRRGRNLFQRKFKHSEGAGPRTGDGEGDINTVGSIGAGLADSCALCHGRPRGSAGFGGDVFTRPDSRDAPHLFGLGLQEQLADEITTELRAIRDAAIDQALNGGGGGGSTLTPEQASILSADDVSEWSLNTGGAISQAGGAIAVTTSGGWTEVDSDVLGDLTSVSTTLSYDFFLPSAAPWGEVSAVVIAPSQGITWTELFPRVQLSSLTPGQFNSVSFPIPAGVRTALENATDVRIKVIVNAPNLGSGQYQFDNVALTDSAPPQGPGPVTVSLDSKGINYGTLSVDAQGNVDTSNVQGVDADLRVRPFFAEGTTITMREFLVGAFNAEMGIQINDADLAAVEAGNTVITPSGMVMDPTLDTFETNPGSETTDPNDTEPVAPGLGADAGTALADFMEFYLLNYFKPGHYQVTAQADLGRATFNQIGCNNCHQANFTIDSDRRVADVETEYDPVNGVFNNLFATASTRFDIVPDGAAGGDPNQPFILPSGDPFLVEDIFTDFKRHDLGTELHERNFDNTIHTTFITEPLWGVGSSAPYGHDGRAINLREIILRHGGEAAGVRSNYLALTNQQRGWIDDFLGTLILFPPDDTASNLNSGTDIDPSNPDFPQRAHGNIKLPALFQVASEGPE